MKKIIMLITAAMLVLCTSCSDKKSAEDIYKDLRENSQTVLNESENNYYIRISETEAGVHTLQEASKSGADSAFMESCTDGSVKFFRKGKYIESSPETFYVKSEKSAEWSDFSYDSTAEKYSQAYTELLKNDSYTIEKKESEDKEAPYKITAKFDVNAIDTKALFSNSGNYGSVTITFLTDKSGEIYKNIALNCQFDYNDTIYIYSVQFGEPNSPDSDGNGGQRPADIENVYKSNSDTAKSSY